MSTKIENARITGTYLGLNRGNPSFMIDLSLGGNVATGFGGWSLSHSGYGIKLLFRIMEVVGVEQWEDLTGKMVRLRTNDVGWRAIGNALEDRWCDPENDLAEDKTK